MAVSVRTLKDRLSEYLRRAQQGERVTVTDHGRPIAALVPLAVRGRSPRQRLVALEECGEVSAPSGEPFQRVRRSRVRGRPVSSSLLADRG